MYYKVISYLFFWLKSTNQHGVHSPFVFNLVTKCFYKKADREKTIIYSKVRKSLLNNLNRINVTDIGAGSKVFKSNSRKISQITKVAGISNKRALLLIRLAEYFKPQSILEFGTSVGLSSSAMNIGNPNAIINTLEGCPNTANVAIELFNEFKLKNINVTTGEFESSLSNITFNKKLDLVFFDGNHQEKPTLQYFEHCLEFIHNDSVFIFDDIYWSKEMQSAWKKIKEHPRVKVTIDTFKWGIVFFRKEQEKEHFTIRL